ncbi:MAG TPA: PASTA domain-containing protein, partial [Myxococcota bacterium]
AETKPPVLPEGTGVMPDVRGLSARAALRAVAAVGAEVTVTGHGRVVMQDPGPGFPIDGPVSLTLEVQP